ncbi:MAG TPA: hypothetical protein DCM10_09725 [Xanthomarina gelatinilytica]|jgi:hypothetical protein|nr:hypothetical protein [Xanthomarina gelatinilytica]
MNEIFDLINEKDNLNRVNDSDLSEMGALCKELVEMKKSVKQTDLELKAKKEALQELQNRIANALKDKNLYSFKLMDGSTVTWKEKIRAHIKPENIDNAYQYIRDQGAGDLIKNEVSFSFGRGQDIEAKQVKEMFRENGYEPSEKEGIQWNTLDAWVRESLQKAAEKGEPFPEETFGVFRTNDVTIKT